jgi:hypothetical protein
MLGIGVLKYNLMYLPYIELLSTPIEQLST